MKMKINKFFQELWDDIIIPLMPGIILVSAILFFLVLIPYTADKQEERKYKEHEKYIGKNIVLDGDTVTILEWRSGRYDTTRGFVLSNGMTVDDIIVESNFNNIN